MSSIPKPSFSLTEMRTLINDGMDFFGKDWQSFATKYNFALTEYYESKVKSLSKLKIFYSSDVINLQDIYVPQNIKIKSDIYSQDEFLGLISKEKKFVISATAGAGKSCMMKNMFLDVLRFKKPYFPIFFELRKINEKQKSLLDSLVDDISNFNKRFCDDNLDYLLKRENTLLFLDGFDEINHNDKDKFIHEINRICEIYPDLIIIVSSRPELGGFRNFSYFNTAKVDMLNIEQSVSMINKLDYDSEVTARFVKALRNDLYKKHYSFSSNPLLLTIMLVTFEKYGEVPEKIHLFYDMAYQALFTIHDNSKQGYKRKSLTNLDINEFKKVFSLFCLVSYSKEKFNFNNDFFMEYLRVCLDSKGYETIDEKKLKVELMSNIPLIMRDGLNYCFSHRSFQEYFTAYYLTNTFNVSEEVYENIGYRGLVDGVMDMAYEIDKSLMEDKWVLPQINKILEQVVNPTSYNEKYHNTIVFYEKCFFHKEEGNDDISLVVESSSVLRFCHFLGRKYSIRLNRIDFSKVSSDNYDILSDYFPEHIGEFSATPSLDLINLSNNEKKVFIEMGGGNRASYYIDFLSKVKKIIEESKKDTIDLDSILFQ